MAARTPAMALQIEQAVANAIRTHAEMNPDQWAQVPAKVDYGPKASHTDAPRPLIVVHSDGSRELATSNTGRHRADLSIMIFAFSESADDPSRGIHDLVADIKRAIANDETLAAEGSVLQSGYLRLESHEVYVDIEDGGAGFGTAVLRYMANYQWTHDAP